MLLLLAPFRGFINIELISNYTEQLDKIDNFKGYDLEKLESVVNEAEKWGLLSPINTDYPQLLTIHPILPYFIKIKLNKIDKIIEKNLQKQFKIYYEILTIAYTELMKSNNPQKKEIGITFTNYEYENIYQVLQFCLDKQEGIISFLTCLDIYLELVNNRVTKLKLLQCVHNSLSNYKLAKKKPTVGKRNNYSFR